MRLAVRPYTVVRSKPLLLTKSDLQLRDFKSIGYAGIAGGPIAMRSVMTMSATCSGKPQLNHLRLKSLCTPRHPHHPLDVKRKIKINIPALLVLYRPNLFSPVTLPYRLSRSVSKLSGQRRKTFFTRKAPHCQGRPSGTKDLVEIIPRTQPSATWLHHRSSRKQKVGWCHLFSL